MIVRGIITKDAVGNEYFIAFECEYCQMNTAGKHAYNCPNNSQSEMINIDKNYDLNTNIKGVYY